MVKIKNKNNEDQSKKDKKIIPYTETGVLVKHYLKEKEKKQLTDPGIAKKLGCARSLVDYYKKRRPENLYEKKRSKLPEEIIKYIYRQGENKKTTQMNGRLLAERVNKILEKKM